MSKGTINKVILIGNIGKDIESRYMPNGNAVANITLATTESWKDKNTGAQEERTEWHRLVAFRKTAEILQQYGGKGTKIYVEGHLQTRKWQDQNGQDRYTTEIVVDNFQFLGGNKQGQQQSPAAGQQASGDFQAPSEYIDDEIPF